MTKIAFSLDLNRDVHISEVDELYNQGKICSKYSFSCPNHSIECKGEITCANLTTPKHKRKKDIYFVPAGEHKECCDMRRKETVHFDNIDDLPKININFSLSDSTKSKNNTLSNVFSENDERNHKKSNAKSRSQQSKRFSTLIRDFANGLNYEVRLTNDEKISLRDLFINIREQDIDELDDELRIYYGLGWVNEKKDGYVIKFRDRFKYREQLYQPSFFIPRRYIENNSTVMFSVVRFNELHSTTSLKKFYIAAELPPKPKEVLNKVYLNFYLEDLGHFFYEKNF